MKPGGLATSWVTAILLAAALAACSESAEEGTDATDPTDATVADSTGSDAPPAYLPMPDGQKMMGHVTVLASEEYDGRVPGTDGGDKAVEYIRQQFQDLGLAMKVQEDDGTPSYLQPFDHEGRRIPNLVGVLEGRDEALKSQVVMVTAHFDHVGSTGDCGDNEESEQKVTCLGADDDASGVAVLLEMARLLVEGKVEPKRTVVFAAFNAEEAGMLGSAWYVAHPAYPLADVKAVVNIDMVGRGDGSGIALLGTQKEDGSDNAATMWIKTLTETSAAAMGLAYKVDKDKPEGDSDCASFAAAQVPCVFVWSLPDKAHDTYHQPSDTVASLEPSALLVSGKMVWAALHALATRPGL